MRLINILQKETHSNSTDKLNQTSSVIDPPVKVTLDVLSFPSNSLPSFNFLDRSLEIDLSVFLIISILILLEKVVVRVRPVNDIEKDVNRTVRKVSSDTVSVGDRRFTFDSVFDSNANQVRISSRASNPILISMLFY